MDEDLSKLIFPLEEKGPFLPKFTTNLTQLAKEGNIDPVIGRDQEIRRLMQILSRRTKNNPVLIGEPGVGKTAIVEGLAQRIAKGDVPDSLKEKELLMLDIPKVLAGAKFRGEFESRIKGIIKEVEEAAGKYIIFIDEIHLIVGAGGGEGAVDASNMLKPPLARGTLRLIGATTLDEYRKNIEKDAALERRLQPVMVLEPSVEDTIAILRGIKEKYEIHHGVKISDDALIAAAKLSDRYISERFLPDKAIDLIDEAASSLRIEIESMPTDLDLKKRKITQLEIEIAGLKGEEGENAQKRLAEIKERLKKLKEEVLFLNKEWEKQREILRKLQNTKKEIDEKKALMEKAERNLDLEEAARIKYGVLPTLSKKLSDLEEEWERIPEEKRLLKEEVTEDEIANVVSRWTGIPLQRLLEAESVKLINLEKELSERVLGQDEALEKIAKAIRRNRAGLSEGKGPIGTFLFLGPTGVGKTETAKALAQVLMGNENNLLRIDMSEYQEEHTVSRLIGAPPGYVGYEEGGQLTESVRRRPYSVILLDEIEKAHPNIFNLLLQVFDDGRLTDGLGRVVDFKNTIIIMTSNLGGEIIQKLEDRKEVEDKIGGILRSTFKPEFLNRIDAIVIYKQLDKKIIEKIVEIQIIRIISSLAEKGLYFEIDKKSKEYLVEKGYDPLLGARPLKRLINEVILDEISLLILEKKVKKGDKIKVVFNSVQKKPEIVPVLLN